ncbi:MAG: hypothetical protein QXK12_06645 [Candidatus Nezhaarchaeales archaeon]
MLSGEVAKEVNERFKVLASIALGFDLKQVKNIALKLGSKPLRDLKVIKPPLSVVDYLNTFESAVAYYFLDKAGLKSGVDHVFQREGANGYFILLVKPSQAARRALRVLDKLRLLSLSKRYAVKLLKELRVKGLSYAGDVDEALNLGFLVVKAKEKALSKPCPMCNVGRLTIVKEKVYGSSILIIIEHPCYRAPLLRLCRKASSEALRPG